jgi:S-(hydroxymethyl)glutathione dehydrogenase / alcohol dehydrogenase
MMLKGTPLQHTSNLSSFAEYMLVHERSIVKIRADMPLDRAAVIGCAVTTGAGRCFEPQRSNPDQQLQ